MKKIISIFYSLLLITVSLLPSCKKLTEVELPENLLGKDVVFNSDQTATAAMLGIYSKMQSGPFNSGNASFGQLAGLSSDELTCYSTEPAALEFENNAVSSDNWMLVPMWLHSYNVIYQANQVIESLSASGGVSPALKKRLIAEAKFVRAFSHLALVNVFGDIPLVTVTDYAVNARVGRTSVPDVYQKIIDDLIAAESDLPADYAGGDRVRPNKHAAAALLARAYLYLGDWAKAEQKAAAVLGAANLFTLPPLTDVFLTGSPEAIWQLMPSQDQSGNGFTQEASIYSPAMVMNYNGLRMDLYNSFEPGDERKNVWTGTDGTYFYPTKYRQYTYGPLTEYSMVFRLAEMYLIHAEASIRQNDIAGGIADLNLIRDRARGAATPAVPDPLPPLSTALSQANAMAAVEAERRHELFTEWGHRWFDLKRWKKATAVLSAIKSNWSPTDELYPLPNTELRANSNLTQNPGY